MGHGGTGRSRPGPIPTNTRSRRHQGGHGVVTAPQILGHGGTGAATTLRHTKQNTHAIKVSFVGTCRSLATPSWTAFLHATLPREHSSLAPPSLTSSLQEHPKGIFHPSLLEAAKRLINETVHGELQNLNVKTRSLTKERVRCERKKRRNQFP